MFHILLQIQKEWFKNLVVSVNLTKPFHKAQNPKNWARRDAIRCSSTARCWSTWWNCSLHVYSDPCKPIVRPTLRIVVFFKSVILYYYKGLGYLNMCAIFNKIINLSRLLHETDICSQPQTLLLQVSCPFFCTQWLHCHRFAGQLKYAKVTLKINKFS